MHPACCVFMYHEPSQSGRRPGRTSEQLLRGAKLGTLPLIYARIRVFLGVNSAPNAGQTEDGERASEQAGAALDEGPSTHTKARAHLAPTPDQSTLAVSICPGGASPLRCWACTLST